MNNLGYAPSASSDNFSLFLWALLACRSVYKRNKLLSLLIDKAQLESSMCPFESEGAMQIWNLNLKYCLDRLYSNKEQVEMLIS